MGKEFLNLMEDWQGWSSVSGKVKADESKIASAIDLLENKAGDPAYVHEFKMKEAITTSDFPYLFGQVLERDILARYQTAPTDWQPYTKMRNVKDFRIVDIHKVQGNDNILPEVAQKGEYLVSPMSDFYYSLAVKKYGRQFDISWESVINDYYAAFGDLPQRFADAAINTEAYQVSALITSATGPNALLFGAPITDIDGQAVTNRGTLQLTPTNLATTLGLMAAQVDVQGKPLGIRGIHVVVPPVLEITARQILTSTALRMAMTYPQAGITANVLADLGLQLHINPWLPVIDVSGNGNTTWYIFAEPSQGAAVYVARLRGYEQPEICMKDSDKVAMTGGALSPFTGDFATDNIFYRVRHVFGGVQGDPRFCYSQLGTTQVS
jgi:hypothetical protein